MSACEKCWADAYGSGNQAAEYYRLVRERNCTPEQQAGPDAARCEPCGGRRVRHQITGQCMVDKNHYMSGSHGLARLAQDNHKSDGNRGKPDGMSDAEAAEILRREGITQQDLDESLARALALVERAK